ncbi:MAG: hypothetical protein RIE59_24470, partial [Imperialibacter sp.]
TKGEIPIIKLQITNENQGGKFQSSSCKKQMRTKGEIPILKLQKTNKLQSGNKRNAPSLAS